MSHNPIRPNRIDKSDYENMVNLNIVFVTAMRSKTSHESNNVMWDLHLVPNLCQIIREGVLQGGGLYLNTDNFEGKLSLSPLYAKHMNNMVSHSFLLHLRQKRRNRADLRWCQKKTYLTYTTKNQRTDSNYLALAYLQLSNTSLTKI